MRNTRNLLRVILILFALTGSRVYAATCTSTSSGNWSSSGIWSCGHVPVAGDDVVIDGNGDTVTLDVTVPTTSAINSLTFDSANGNNKTNELDLGTNTLSVAGDVTFNGGSLDRPVALTANGGTLNVGTSTTTGNIVVNTGNNVYITMSGASTINVNGNFDSGANYTPSTTSTVNYNGTGAQSIGIYTYNNLSVNKTAGTASLTGNVTVNSNLTVGTSGGTLDLGAYTANRATSGGTLTVVNGANLLIGGTNGLPANYTTYTFGASSTENFDGTNQTISNKTYGNLTLSGSGTKIMSAGTTTIQGNFTLGSGVTYNGTSNNPTVNLAGNFSNSGTFNSGTGVFTFNGTTTQTLTGATTFTNMTLNNDEGLLAGLSLNNNMTVTGTLYMGAGLLFTNSNKVIMGTSGTFANVSSARYVVGTVEIPFTTTTNFNTQINFPIGDPVAKGNYTPVQVTFTNVTHDGSLDVSTPASPSDHPQITSSQLDPTQSVNRYWTLTGVNGLAGTYDATFNYVTGDKDAGSSPPNYISQYYNNGTAPGGTWFNTTRTGGTGNSIDLSGLTAFGDFAVAQPNGTNLNHYVISPASTTAINCAPDQITIFGHRSNHDVLTTLTTTISLSTSTNHGDWSLVPSDTYYGAFTAIGSDAGTATYTFGSGDNGTVTLNFSDVHPETVNINVVDGSGITENSGTANNGSETVTTTDPNIDFVNSGFRITDDSNNPITIGQQIAGKGSDIAPGAQTIAIQAIRTDTNTYACTGVFANGTTVNVEMAFQCNNPTTCSAGKSVNITNNSITTAIPGNPNSGVTTYASVPLKFSGTMSEAPFTFNYPDAGIIRLYMRRLLGSGIYMSGNSNQFTVRPFGFYVNVTGNPAATDATGTVFKKAGQNFTVNTSAVVWQAADDNGSNGGTANDGIPDPGADLSDNAVTPNFGNEITPETATITQTLLAPAGGDAGTLTGGGPISVTNGGPVATSMSWNEVGIIRLDASLTSPPYLTSTDNVTGSTSGPGNTAGDVGRFTPDHFTVAYNTPQFATACSVGSFTYMGEPFHYATAPVMTVTARSAGSPGSVTRNYTGTSPAANAWFKLTNTSLTSDPNYNTQAKRYTAATGTLDLTLLPAVSTDPTIADLGGGNPSNANAGEGTLTFSDGGGLAFTHNTETAPFNADISLAVSVIDSDGIVYAGNPARFGAATAGNGIAFDSGKEMRFGRLNITNVTGSELMPLSMPLRTEYYNGFAYVTNTGDSCTALTLSSDISLSNPQTAGGAAQPGNATMTVGSGTSQVTSGNITFSSGTGALTFSAPGAGNTGYIDVQALLSAAGLSYLQYDWDGNGSFDNNPTGRVTWGIYAGPKGLIYIREPW